MSEDPTSVLLELEEARAAHKRITGLIEARMRELDELWRVAKPADRLLAVQRLVQTNALDEDASPMIEAKNERVREHLARARTERKKLENLGKLAQEDGQEPELKHKVLMLELDLQRAEQERDELIDGKDLRGPLYFCGETFVRTKPFAPGEMPLKDLAVHAKHFDERIKDLERQVPRRGAKFTKKGPDGREKTLIRMLPALTMEGD